MTFTDFGLNNDVLKAIGELGFESPTPIQQLTFTHFTENDNDLIGLAQTGTGKTAAFSLPIIQTYDPDSKDIQAIILAPTRELCLQIATDIASYTKYMRGFEVVAVYGGANITTQINKLKDRPQVVVGTPGRTLDLIKRNKLHLDKIQWLVFDEADEMLSMGFKDELDAILEACPTERKTLLFSATMPQGIEDIAMNYMKAPSRVTAGSANVSASKIKHKYYLVNARDRYTALKRIADANPDIYAIIFCRTKAGTQEVADKMSEDGYSADALHGDLSQAQRDFVMSRFRKRQIQMLVATDVAARGIDVDDLTHVIHYQLPDETEVYIHRSGRTGRAGKEGESVTIIHRKEQRRIRDIERMIKTPIEQSPIPIGTEICEAQLFHLVKKVKNVEVNESEIEPYLPKLFETFKDTSKEELIKSFFSVEFNRFLDYYQSSEDINLSDNQRGRSSQGSGEESGMQMTKMVINHGKKSGLTPPLLMGFLNELMEGTTFNIGKIEINQGNSTFWVESSAKEDLQKAVKKSDHHGVSIWIDKDQSEDEQPYFRSGRSEGGNRFKGKSKGRRDDKKGGKGSDNGRRGRDRRDRSKKRR